MTGQKTGLKSRINKPLPMARTDKSYPGSIYVPKGTNRLYLKYKRVRVTTGLLDTKQNRKFAEQWLWDLYRIHHGMAPLLLQPDGTMPTMANLNQTLPIVFVAGAIPGVSQGQQVGTVAGIPVSGQQVHAAAHQHIQQENASATATIQNTAVAESESNEGTQPELKLDKKVVTTLRHCDIWNDFVLYNEARDLEDRTRKDYKWIVRQVITDDTQVISRIDTEGQLAAWKRRESHLGSTSVNLYLRSFSSYCNYLRDQELLDKEINLKQFRKKGEKPKNEKYDEDEYHAVIQYFDTHVPKNGKVGPYRRVSRLLRWFLASGFRIKETLHLYRSNFNLRFRRIEIYNKRTKNTEYFPITDEILAILEELPSDWDKLFEWSYSSTSAILRMIKAGFEAVGLKARKGFHTFRKTFADQLYLKNVDLYDRKELLRHSDIRTTAESYSYTKTDRLAKVMEKANKKTGSANIKKSAKAGTKNPSHESVRSSSRLAGAGPTQDKRSRAHTRGARAATKTAATARKTHTTERRTQAVTKRPRKTSR